MNHTPTHLESKSKTAKPSEPFFSATIQKKLSVGSANDSYEVEADNVADRVMQMSEPQPQPQNTTQTGALIQRKCSACEQEEKLQMKPLAESITPLIQRSSHGESGGHTPNHIEGQIIGSKGSGSHMDHSTQHFMESRFGTDFSDVKIHTGSQAVQMSRELNAQAFTVGSDIYFNEGKYSPNSDSGKHLLAHELTHTVQQGGGIGRKVQKFEASEISSIASLSEIIDQATTFANNASTLSGFVEQAGGSSAFTQLDSSVLGRALTHRYLISCRCGMIDMRHFYQLMYIAQTYTNRRATSMGRDHELQSEATSRFAAEDTTSNALGAFFGANNFDLFHTSVSVFINRLRNYLNRCNPINFSVLPQTEKDAIVNYYAARDSAGVPINQNEEAIPTILNISLCNGGTRSFPFVVDPNERRTITSRAFISGTASITDDDGVRDFVATQRTEIVRNINATEKIRLTDLLLSGWVDNTDLDALQIIIQNSTTEQIGLIRASVRITSLTDIGQRFRLMRILGTI